MGRATTPTAASAIASARRRQGRSASRPMLLEWLQVRGTLMRCRSSSSLTRATPRPCSSALSSTCRSTPQPRRSASRSRASRPARSAGVERKGAPSTPQQAAAGGDPGGERLPFGRAPVAHRHQGHQLQLHPAAPVVAQFQQHLPAGGGPGAEAVDVAADRPQAVAPGPLQGPLPRRRTASAWRSAASRPFAAMAPAMVPSGLGNASPLKALSRCAWGSTNGVSARGAGAPPSPSPPQPGSPWMARIRPSPCSSRTVTSPWSSAAGRGAKGSSRSLGIRIGGKWPGGRGRWPDGGAAPLTASGSPARSRRR